jgi:glycosyltransferase involved in cell wall biosynthesis
MTNAAAASIPPTDATVEARPDHLVVFQNGDFAEAYDRFQNGGAETYGGQKFTVEFVAGLADARQVTVLCCCTRPHDVMLKPGLRSLGIAGADTTDAAFLSRTLAELAPDLLICRSPIRPVLQHCTDRNIPTLPLFADNFANRGLRQAWRNIRLRRLLGRRSIPAVCNHSLNATRSIARAMLYPKSRLVPWDWAPLVPDPTPKSAPAADGPVTAFYAGALSAAKGVGDCIEAAAVLQGRGVECRFSFAGAGDIEAWTAEARRRGVEDQVRFLGPVANDEVRNIMRAHDVVVVPSRHEYSEGLPKTLLEGMASRSPVIVSDHPAFVSRVRDGETCLVFRGGDPGALAARLEELRAAPALYEALSAASAEALGTFYIGTRWHAVIDLFLDDPTDAGGWVKRHSLTALGY